MYAISYPDLPKNKSSQHLLLSFFIFCLATTSVLAQANSEVFLLTLEKIGDKIQLGPPKNISNNSGYDNQPSFYNDNLVLFSSTRNGQTDIAAYAANKDSVFWKTNTSGGSEYSPLKIPGSKNFSAIRLDEDGKQLLYEYTWKTGRSRVVLEDLKVGYHLWFNEDILVNSVLVEDRMDLIVSNLKDHSNYTFQRNVGRSLQKIPNTRLVSFISKENEDWVLKSVNPVSGATEVITSLPRGVQDICWLPDGSVLAGQNNQLLRYNPKKMNWEVIASFPEGEMANITRLATNAISGLLLMVAEIPNK
ncbi:PD40 domain-containing protein [Muriicola soli]|uniref:Uncharacterized protein n=1 Tax=Muriicola soli TaxID=2507538 RepID=A0A411E9U5_9FLAO|nr:PD40 domain-containing protein [Muriicola soli]QBA64472.1 hypothetical protein EQY75_08010 [Muriicola soli]